MQQLALYVVIYSPIQMAADLPENYERYPDAFQFIIDVPTDWEESVAVAGEVGDFVAIARKQRSGKDWYFGAISDELARSFELKLSFLDKGKEYVAKIYRDSADAHWDHNPYGFEIEQQTLNSDSMLGLKLAAGGRHSDSIQAY